MQEKKLSAFHPACPLAFNFKTSLPLAPKLLRVPLLIC